MCTGSPWCIGVERAGGVRARVAWQTHAKTRIVQARAISPRVNFRYIRGKATAHLLDEM